MNTDLSIARSVTPKPIEQVAADLGLQSDELWLYGTARWIWQTLSWMLVKWHRNSDFSMQNLSLTEKIETIATRIYSADGIVLSSEAQSQLERYEALVYGRFQICIAKTPLSISHDPKWKGVPSGYEFPIREVRARVGAGFIYPLCGAIRTMVGWPARPAFMDIDLDDGRVTGLS